MPPVAAWAVLPAAAEGYCGLTRSALRVLTVAGIIGPRGRLTHTDVVVARVCKHLYWHGPAGSAPGQSDTRDAIRSVAATAAAHVRALLESDTDVQLALVSMEDGEVRSAARIDQLDVDMDGESSGPWMLFPLRRWWQEVQQLPTGALPNPTSDFARFERIAARHGMTRVEFYSRAAERFAEELVNAEDI